MNTVSRSFVALLFLLVTSTAMAQTYPVKSVRMVVPFAAGAGSNDIMARLIAQKLGDAFGQQFVVDNRPGASGIIGTDIVAKAQPDGYTLLMMSLTFTVLPSLFSKLPYDTVKDLTPVTMVASAPLMLVVHPSVPAKIGAGIHCVRESQSRQAQFRLGRRGRDAASRRRNAEEHGGTADDAHSVQGRCAGARRSRRRPDPVHAAKTFPARCRSPKPASCARWRSPISSARRSCPTCRRSTKSGLKGYQIVGWNGLFVPAGTPPASRQFSCIPRSSARWRCRRQGKAVYPGRRRRRRHAAALRRVRQSRNPEVGASRQGCRAQGRIAGFNQIKIR